MEKYNLVLPQRDISQSHENKENGVNALFQVDIKILGKHSELWDRQSIFLALHSLSKADQWLN